MIPEKEKSNIEWLFELCNIKHKEWHQDKVLKPSQLEKSRFYIGEEKHFEAYINPEHIVGIEYAYSYNCFNEITWLELINSLKRFDQIRRNLSTHDELLQHAHNDYNEAKIVAKYGDQYITLQGQHRLALCKFLGVKSVKVQVVEYPFDYEMYDKYLSQKSFLNNLLNESLITQDFYEENINVDLKLKSVKIKGNYIYIHPNCYDKFIYFYRNLSINKFLVSLSILNQQLFGMLSPHNNNIKSEKDIIKYKNFLRLVKSGYIS
jgi:hypothetical protein